MQMIKLNSKLQITEQETTWKAIQMAYNNGWRPVYNGDEMVAVEVGVSDVHWIDKKGYKTYCDVYRLFFSHDFAKALWGEGEVCMICGVGPDDKVAHKDYDPEIPVPAWYFHLQQMVIAEDPIKYLGENI
jgi:hypothetical protein